MFSVLEQKGEEIIMTFPNRELKITRLAADVELQDKMGSGMIFSPIHNIFMITSFAFSRQERRKKINA